MPIIPETMFHAIQVKVKKLQSLNDLVCSALIFVFGLAVLSLFAVPSTDTPSKGTVQVRQDTVCAFLMVCNKRHTLKCICAASCYKFITQYRAVFC